MMLKKYDRRGGKGKAAESGVTAKGRFDAVSPSSFYGKR